MSDLTEFLRARLAEDAEAARTTADEYGAAWSADEPMDTVSSDTGADVAEGPATPLRWIARHDPARVLREAEAKRAVVDRYAWLREHGDTGDAAWVLLLLAAVYADHPDYQPEWSPAT
jgi:hypothetical protein